MAEINGGVEEGKTMDPAPEIELVPSRSAGEASKAVRGQIHGKRTTLRRRGAVDRARPAKLLPVTPDGFEDEKLQYPRHRDGLPNQDVIDSRHSASIVQRRGTRGHIHREPIR